MQMVDEEVRLPRTGELLFRVDKFIAEGSFGEVYAVSAFGASAKYAMKRARYDKCVKFAADVDFEADGSRGGDAAVSSATRERFDRAKREEQELLHDLQDAVHHSNLGEELHARWQRG